MAVHTVYISPAHMDPDYTIERQVLGPDVDLRVFTSVEPLRMGDEAKDADAIMVWRLPVHEQTLRRLRRCKLIIRMGVGYDIVDTAAAREQGIPVANVPDYCTGEVADHTLALLLAVARGVTTFNEGVHRGDDGWAWDAAGPLRRITGRTLGIIGLGRIGAAVALRAKAFGLRVAFYDPYVVDGMDRALGLLRLDQDSLLAQADYLTFHTPLTQQTRGMADQAFFQKVKPGVVVINTSRGPVVDIGALEAAMRSGRVAAAALDVLPAEPPVPEPALIHAWRRREPWLHGRLIITPHAAFYSEEADRDMRVKAAQTVRDVLQGKAVRNCVNC